MRKNKLHVVNIMLARDLGGIQQVFCDYDLALTERGHEVLNVISNNALIEKELKKQKAKYVKLFSFNQYDFLARFKLKKIIKNFSADIVICHGIRATKFAKGSKVKIIAVAHNQKVKKLMEADSIIIVSEYIREYLVNLGFEDKKIFHVANFIR